jgi:hypothetical protein
MLNAVIGKSILDGLFALEEGYIKFDGQVFLGLLTRLPNINGTPHSDNTYFSELNSPGYRRVQLDVDSRINKKYTITDAVSNEVIEDDNGDACAPAVVSNQAMIIFPENTMKETVVGFGLFRSGDKTDPTLPFLWGEVSGTDGEKSIEIDQDEVPIIREGGFKISFM